MSIETRDLQVTIKTITVDGKKLTKSLVNQLPVLQNEYDVTEAVCWGWINLPFRHGQYQYQYIVEIDGKLFTDPCGYWKEPYCIHKREAFRRLDLDTQAGWQASEEMNKQNAAAVPPVPQLFI